MVASYVETFAPPLLQEPPVFRGDSFVPLLSLCSLLIEYRARAKSLEARRSGLMKEFNYVNLTI